MIGIKYIYLKSYGEDLILRPRHDIVYPKRINMSDDKTCMEFPLSDDCDVLKKDDRGILNFAQLWTPSFMGPLSSSISSSFNC
jgi:hypothetical protein